MNIQTRDLVLVKHFRLKKANVIYIEKLLWYRVAFV